MTIFVTGGAGFIGANFVLDWLHHCNEEVINYDKLTYAGHIETLKSLNGNKKHIFIKGDIADEARILEIYNKYKPRAVINFAAESHVDRSINGPDEFINTNIVGTSKLLNATLKYWRSLDYISNQNFRFLHVSTDEVFGTLEHDQPPFDENNQYLPNSPYSASKAASDHLVRAWHHTYGIPVLTTHCSNNYGPFHFPEKLIPLSIVKAINGESLPIYGDGKQIRDWLYVKDHCRALRHVLKLGIVGETYNIGGDNEKTNNEVVRRICEILDELKPLNNKESYLSQITHVADRPGHDRRYAINAQKIQTTLGWEPVETFESGLKKTVMWYLENEKWVQSLQSRI